MVSTNIKAFILWQGICAMNVLYPSLSKQFVFSISSSNPVKTLPRAILRELVQPDAAQVTTMMTLWKMTTVFCSSSWNFLSLHYVIYFILWIFQISTKNVTLQVPFRGISWENIHFCGFLKKTYIANGRKIKVDSSKKC